MANDPPIEPELLVPPPRSLTWNRDAWRKESQFYQLLLGCWCASLLGGGLGLLLFRYVSGIGFGLLVLSGLVGALSVLLSAGVLWALARDAWMVRYGLAGTAVIEAVRAENYSGDFGGYYDINYRLVSATGDTLRGCWRKAEPPLWTCKKGDHVTVLHRPRNLRQHRVYRCSLVRARDQTLAKTDGPAREP